MLYCQPECICLFGKIGWLMSDNKKCSTQERVKNLQNLSLKNTSLQYQVPVLETERLLLRELRYEDFETFAEMNATPSFRRYIGDGKPINRELAWRAFTGMVGHWVMRGFGFWALEVKQTNEFIGYLGIHYPEDWPCGVEIGWGLTQEAQGKGYAIEGAIRAMRYGFETLELTCLVSLISEGNDASKSVALKLGEQHIKNIDFYGFDVCVFEVSREAFFAKHG